MKEGNMDGRSGMFRQFFSDAPWRALIQSPARSSLVVFFLFSLLVGAFLSTRFLDYSSPIVTNSAKQSLVIGKTVGNITVSLNDSTSTHVTVSHNESTQAYIMVSDNESTQTPMPVSDNETTEMQIPVPDKESTQTQIPVSDNEPTHTHITDSDSEFTQTRIIPPRKIEFPIKCADINVTQTCPRDYPEKTEVDPNAPPPSVCPEYFRWIHEDLRPWKETGITRDMVEMAKRTANFRLVILNGKAYVETFQRAFQTRDVFTLWGILQLLRRYPGKVPDLELMFDCVDWPVISKHYPWPNATAPPLFRYCGDDSTLDIVFPDWSFWGWAEINIKPWDPISKEIKEGNKILGFSDRAPYAYWKGNPFVAPTRMDLLKCNVSDKQDWGAHIFIQDWNKESHGGFKESNLAHQCIDRYKIYIEGSAWSVSEKYILACDSVTLVVKPKYYDFFSRGLIPIQHYWPIRENDKCRSIKFAVEWGNNHKQKAEAIGMAASKFIREDVKMEYVYDYMLHLLTEYSKLLKFKPTIPKNAVELCSETMACRAEEYQKKFMMESLVTSPSDSPPCTLPPPYDRVGLRRQLKRKIDAEKQVEKWEMNYWNNGTTQQ